MPAPRKSFGRWRSNRWDGRARTVTVALGTFMVAVVLVFVVGMVAALVYAIGPPEGALVPIEEECGPGTGCSLFWWGYFALVPIAAAVVFFLVRLEAVRFTYRSYAHDHPDELLDTKLLSPVVIGREDLCDVLQGDLQSRWEDDDGSEHDDSPLRRLWRAVRRRWRPRRGHRPILLVGGVGLGKTAVLARLTQILAERGAVPVPIRLRAAQHGDELDLMELARAKFMDVARVLSEAEGDKIWRRLQDNDQLVILADGLEEALMNVEDIRESAIRAAFEQFRRRHNAPLIVSSRPHAALRHIDAATVELEPLEPHAALEYVTGGAVSDERSHEARIVECAELVEMPLFMHIARELFHTDDGLEGIHTQGVDRLTIRVRLIERWMHLLGTGKIRPGAPVEPGRRQEVIKELEGIAAFGLMNDSLEVKFTDYTESSGAEDEEESLDGATAKETLETTTEKLRDVGADAELLGLVDARSDGVLFRHSVTQAYLGSKAIGRGLKRHGSEWGKAAKLFDRLQGSLTQPGRELLMALAMSCASYEEPARTRAIRLLLRNVDHSPEKEKCLYTAGAVVAAAAAAAGREVETWSGDGAMRSEPAYVRRAEFRSDVVAWLRRAEREDAERGAKSARDAVDKTRVAREHAVAAADAAELDFAKADLKVQKTAVPPNTAGMSPEEAERAVDLANKRQTVAVAELEKTKVTLRDARTALAQSYSKHAVAHSEASVAATILAEKRLAQALAESPSDRLYELAEESVDRALADVAEARAERRLAARAEAAASNPERVQVARLGEQLAADALVALRLLQECVDLADEQVPPVATADDLVATAVDRLKGILKAAEESGPISTAAAAVTTVTSPASTGPGAEAESMLRTLEELEEDLTKAALMTDEGARELAFEGMSGTLGDVATTAVRIADEHDDTNAALTLLAEFRLGLLSLAGAWDALGELEAADASTADGGLAAVRAAAECLVPVLETAEKARGVRAEVIAGLPLLGLVFAKAEYAKAVLGAAAEEPDPAKRRRMRERLATNLRAVSDRAEDLRLAKRRNGLPRDTRRGTSRTQVLVPFTDKMPQHDADTAAGVQAGKLDAVARLADAAQYLWLWKICKTETDTLVRMTAARRLGAGGFAAFGRVRLELELIVAAAEKEAKEPGTASDEIEGIETEPHRAFELMGWLLPLLYTSIEREGSPPEENSDNGPAHRKLLKKWIPLAGGHALREMALAEGMRLAANRTDLPPAQQGFLAARAEDMIAQTSVWFSRIALLQALTLWMLSHVEREGGDDTATNDEAEEKLRKCCKHAGHPLVKETIELCVIALRKRAPANYIWIDERKATARLGAGRDAVRTAGTRTRWIPQTAGWLSLEPRAQKLLGEVVVLLNLADRGDDAETREEHLRRTFDDEEQILPLCMTSPGGREHFDVRRKLDVPVEPGARCVPGCEMRLCPYPGLGASLSRGEISEAFCRAQYDDVAHARRKGPAWQKDQTYSELRQFWRALERRPRV